MFPSPVAHRVVLGEPVGELPRGGAVNRLRGPDEGSGSAENAASRGAATPECRACGRSCSVAKRRA